jgi:hypothetical protein
VNAKYKQFYYLYFDAEGDWDTYNMRFIYCYLGGTKSDMIYELHRRLIEGQV